MEKTTLQSFEFSSSPFLDSLDISLNEKYSAPNFSSPECIEESSGSERASDMTRQPIISELGDNHNTSEFFSDLIFEKIELNDIFSIKANHSPIKPDFSSASENPEWVDKIRRIREEAHKSLFQSSISDTTSQQENSTDSNIQDIQQPNSVLNCSFELCSKCESTNPNEEITDKDSNDFFMQTMINNCFTGRKITQQELSKEIPDFLGRYKMSPSLPPRNEEFQKSPPLPPRTSVNSTSFTLNATLPSSNNFGNFVKSKSGGSLSKWTPLKPLTSYFKRPRPPGNLKFHNHTNKYAKPQIPMIPETSFKSDSIKGNYHSKKLTTKKDAQNFDDKYTGIPAEIFPSNISFNKLSGKLDKTKFNEHSEMPDTELFYRRSETFEDKSTCTQTYPSIINISNAKEKSEVTAFVHSEISNNELSTRKEMLEDKSTSTQIFPLIMNFNKNEENSDKTSEKSNIELSTKSEETRHKVSLTPLLRELENEIETEEEYEESNKEQPPFSFPGGKFTQPGSLAFEFSSCSYPGLSKRSSANIKKENINSYFVESTGVKRIKLFVEENRPKRRPSSSLDLAIARNRNTSLTSINENETWDPSTLEKQSPRPFLTPKVIVENFSAASLNQEFNFSLQPQIQKPYMNVSNTFVPINLSLSSFIPKNPRKNKLKKDYGQAGQNFYFPECIINNGSDPLKKISRPANSDSTVSLQSSEYLEMKIPDDFKKFESQQLSLSSTNEPPLIQQPLPFSSQEIYSKSRSEQINSKPFIQNFVETSFNLPQKSQNIQIPLTPAKSEAFDDEKKKVDTHLTVPHPISPASSLIPLPGANKIIPPDSNDPRFRFKLVLNFAVTSLKKKDFKGSLKAIKFMLKNLKTLPEGERMIMGDKTLKILQKCAANDIYCSRYLGDLHLNGIDGILEADPRKALKFLLTGERKNDSDCVYRASIILEDIGSEKEVLHYLTKAAKEEHPGAMHRLGKALLFGELGLKKDIEMAAMWLKKAAAFSTKDNPKGKYEYALMHEKGHYPIIKQDHEYMLTLLEEGCQLGDPDAHFKCAVGYETSSWGLVYSLKDAYDHYYRAAIRGHIEVLS